MTERELVREALVRYAWPEESIERIVKELDEENPHLVEKSYQDIPEGPELDRLRRQIEHVVTKLTTTALEKLKQQQRLAKITEEES